MTVRRDLFRYVKDYYDEPHRYYHTWDHIEDMLFFSYHYEEDESVNITNLRLMIAYHDAVYNPKANKGDNEKASAELFINDFIYIVGARASTHIKNGILATIDHQPNDDPTIQALLDLDLSWLGSFVPKYDENSWNIRKEYSHVSDEDWKIGRTSFLNSMLERPKIFHTKWGSTREEMARYNMQRELESLK